MRTICFLALVACSENGFHSLSKDPGKGPREEVTGSTQTTTVPLSTPETTPDTTTTPTTPTTTPTTPPSTSTTTPGTTTTPTTPPPAPVEPVAVAGLDLGVVALDLAVLDGSGSYDPNGGGPLVYAWSIVSAPPGSTATLSGAATASAQLPTDTWGTWEVQLDVMNDAGLWDSTPDRVLVVADAEPPVALAGSNRTVDAGSLASLDGTASYDPLGGPLVYRWSIVTAPAGSSAALTSTTVASPGLLTDTDGTWELELEVQNEAGLWDPTPDRVLVIAQPTPPVSDAGPDETYEPLETVVLDGTGSYDPAGYEPLTYSWTLVSRPVNSNAVLDDPTSATPSFFANLAGDYVLELQVTNTLGEVDPTPDEVVITTTPADGFYVELSWPGSADLDLHLLNSSASGIFDCPDDCNFLRPSPSWGVAGSDDDPSLDEDTIPGLGGSGPEIITITAPATDTYEVMVHYYGESGFTDCGLFAACPNTEATINIYLGGVLAETYVETLFDDDDVWEVATIDWPSGLITPNGALTSTTRTSCF